MARKEVRRLPAVKNLYEMLPKGAEGGKEFARLIDLLLFHEGRRTNKRIGLFSDVAGDYHGLDSFAGDTFRKEGTTGYQCKFYPSPLSDAHQVRQTNALLNLWLTKDTSNEDSLCNVFRALKSSLKSQKDGLRLVLVAVNSLASLLGPRVSTRNYLTFFSVKNLCRRHPHV
jgi:hypothetical protein